VRRHGEEAHPIIVDGPFVEKLILRRKGMLEWVYVGAENSTRENLQ